MKPAASPSPPLNGANRYAHIDAMRAFAVMLVVFAHAGLGKIIPGGSGVTIFFTISGFIITHLLLRERDRTGQFSVTSFYFRRTMKIAPPFIAIVALPTLLTAAFGDIDWIAFLSQLFFVFNWFYLSGAATPLDGTDVVWSLSIEEQFYIAFALIWLAAVKSTHWRKILIVVSAAGVMYPTIARVVMASNPAASDRIYYGSDTRLDGIAWGVLAAVVYHYIQERNLFTGRTIRTLGSDWTFLFALALYMTSLVIRDEYFRDTLRYTIQSTAAAIVILFGLSPGYGPIRRLFYTASQWRAISLAGLASYSIYLVHLMVMNSIREIINLPSLLEIPILITLGVGTGIACYHFIEKPCHKYGSRLTKERFRPKSQINR